MARIKWLATLVALYGICAAHPALAKESSEKATSKASAERPDPGLHAPTIDGLTGLFRTVGGGIGARHTFRLSLHFEMFAASDFLAQGDSHSRFLATLAASYTPWKYLEFFVNVKSQANNNDRNDPGRLDDELILALGDFSFGGKFIYPVHKAVKVGARLGITLLNSVGGVSIDPGATSLYLGAVTSFHLDAISKVPVRFHLNLGYQLDNSETLADLRAYYSDFASLHVEKFSLGLNVSRFQMRFGVEAMLQRWTKIPVNPILEFAVDVATGSEDEDFALNAAAFGLTQDQIDGRAMGWMTIGVRTVPVRGLIAELGVDVGIGSPGFGFGPPVVPWQVILGLGYAYDPVPRVKVVEKEVLKTVVRKVERKLGKVRGRVIDEKTLEPVQGAIITFPGRDLTGLSTDPDGGFLSYGFKPGKLPIIVRHPRYKPKKAMATITVGGQTKLEVKLTPRPPKTGRLDGSIVDLKNAGVAATVAITGPQSSQVTAGADGRFSAKLKPGEYTLQVVAQGYLRKEQKITVTAGGTATVAFTISKRPRRSLVKVTRRSIVIRRKVHFATATARIKTDSRQLLDSVADVLLRNPQIARIEVQGHTDNRGSYRVNMRLSQKRAQAVVDYLTKAGVPASRLVAKGYGPTRPKRPNITRRNRALNRRVDFRILKQ
jgi:outer membrane protein OmpA-like peptidoglycan-associated protein